ncbi:hypothetical protein [Synechocystis salina]|uniref:Uncharacterized protein n=1 Tax=Synechocystis salina LEGE 00031 TaxID=1828736 RepID=A0ABR9VT54_9SYNC|nr:hypothetical protein [Synechocystis salina]MBE9242044.1 hypothetical protein [Synechocystis salina LEGE 00041]MBE9254535.1 hypothetical protein [Synechocystis salina LEGE 00031]
MIQPAIHLAQKFGDRLAACDYGKAWDLLSPELKREYSPKTLQTTVEEMISYGSGPIQRAIMMTEWQYTAMENDDVVWLYVALEGEDFGEAVTVIVQ